MITYVMGDIHGYYEELVDVLDQCGFDYDNDRLISLGDVCDRGNNVVECIRHLKTIKNLIYIKGNHDDWTEQWLTPKIVKGAWGIHHDDYRLWYSQGGMKTTKSIEKHDAHEEVFEFLQNAVLYHVDDHNLYVHGGLRNPDEPAERQTPHDLMWDRSLVSRARFESISTEPTVKQYDLCFVGHTPTIYYESTVPVKYNNVWMMDTGICYDGKLSIMDVQTNEFWQNK